MGSGGGLATGCEEGSKYETVKKRHLAIMEERAVDEKQTGPGEKGGGGCGRSEGGRLEEGRELRGSRWVLAAGGLDWWFMVVRAPEVHAMSTRLLPGDHSGGVICAASLWHSSRSFTRRERECSCRACMFW